MTTNTDTQKHHKPPTHCSSSLDDLLESLDAWIEDALKGSKPIGLTLSRARVTITDQYDRIGEVLVALECQNKEVERLREERDEWRSRYIQQNKDLGCEMIEENRSLKNQLTYLSKSKATEILRLSDMIDKREEALGHIAAIMQGKDENGEDLLIGSPAWKSVIRWSIYFQHDQVEAAGNEH